MPLIIDGPGPVAGTLDPGVPLGDRIRAIPGLIGGFFAEDAPVGPVMAWPARFGTGQLIGPNIADRAPTRAEGAAEVRGHAAASLAGAADAFVAGGPATIGLRVNFTDPAVDLQYLFNLVGGSVYAAVYRSNSGAMILDAAVDVSLAMPAGWHNVILTQTATTTTWRIGDASGSAQNAGVGGGQPVLFNRTLGGASSGFRGGISRILMAGTALAADGADYQSMLALLRA